MIINSLQSHHNSSSVSATEAADSDGIYFVLALIFLLIMYFTLSPVYVVISHRYGFRLCLALPSVDGNNVLLIFRSSNARHTERGAQISSQSYSQAQELSLPTDVEATSSQVPAPREEDTHSIDITLSSLSVSPGFTVNHSPNPSQQSLAVSVASTSTIAITFSESASTLVRPVLTA
ncbi:hypothetical protein MVEN_02446900 [Mycena venus]|uniref:Uncharacterized protein n=1 Tax=Mycena venus TaxID=2733690 RepID=A0A8H6WZ04_9AGAR|nr:hypothetical protein MVEN_02446900 [Mycena venus]